jgi:hypothetical protein
VDVYPFIEGSSSYTLTKKDGESKTLSPTDLEENGVCVLANYLHISESFTLKKTMKART